MYFIKKRVSFRILTKPQLLGTYQVKTIDKIVFLLCTLIYSRTTGSTPTTQSNGNDPILACYRYCRILEIL